MADPDGSAWRRPGWFGLPLVEAGIQVALAALAVAGAN